MTSLVHSRPAQPAQRSSNPFRLTHRLAALSLVSGLLGPLFWAAALYVAMATWGVDTVSWLDSLRPVLVAGLILAPLAAVLAGLVTLLQMRWGEKARWIVAALAGVLLGGAVAGFDIYLFLIAPAVY